MSRRNNGNYIDTFIYGKIFQWQRSHVRRVLLQDKQIRGMSEQTSQRTFVIEILVHGYDFRQRTRGDRNRLHLENGSQRNY